MSGSLKAQWGPRPVREVLAGDRPIRKLFTKEQREFFVTYAPEGLALDDLIALGPINVLKLKFVPKELPRPMVAELWFYPDGSRILELSTKCPPGEAFQVSAETKAFLAEQGVKLTGQQQTKTRTALEYSRDLKKAKRPRGRAAAASARTRSVRRSTGPAAAAKSTTTTRRPAARAASRSS